MMHAKLMLLTKHMAHMMRTTHMTHKMRTMHLMWAEEAGGNLKSMVPNKRNSADIIGQLPPKTHKWAPQVGTLKTILNLWQYTATDYLKPPPL